MPLEQYTVVWYWHPKKYLHMAIQVDSFISMDTHKSAIFLGISK
jgi:hypothetical protein